MTSYFPDSMILQIVNSEHILYLLYDYRLNTFLVRGKRESEDIDFPPYSFECNSITSLVSFIDMLIEDGDVDLEIYNIKDLPESSYDITYERLDDSCSGQHQITGYVNYNLNRRDEIVKLLNILKNVINPY